MGRYYYLIAGLKDISFDDEKLQFSFDDFKEEIFSALSSKDRKVIELLLLEYDLRNLLAMLGSDSDDVSDLPFADRGLFSKDQLLELIAHVKSEEKIPLVFPQFLATFIREYINDAWQQNSMFAEDRLYTLYYEFASKSQNEFVRDWFNFNLDLNNLQTAFTGRKYALSTAGLIVGSGEVADALRNSGARDWGLSQSLEFFDEFARLQDMKNLSEREHSLDKLKWRWLDDHTFMHYFTVEPLFAYLIKMQIVERWARLDREKGQALLRQMIADLKDEVTVPSDFGNN